MRARMARGVRAIRRQQARLRFRSSADYWQDRYDAGGTSGAGSTGRLAQFKADTVNQLISDHSVRSVLELGCGDGQQLALLDVADYVGVDVASKAVEICRQKFDNVAGRRFFVAGEEPLPTVDMALSMDVLLHLVEDEVFDRHLRDLFGSASRLVVIYGGDVELAGTWPHVRYRRFTPWISGRIEGWRLAESIPGPWPFDPDDPESTSDAGFYVYVPSSRGHR